MCTAITLKSAYNKIFFGRTMDFSHNIEPHLFVVPKNYLWRNIDKKQDIQTKYQFIGIGQQLGELLAFFDGINDKGLAGAVLYFAGYAKYDNYQAGSNKLQIAAFDFLKYILGNCGSILEVKEAVKYINIIGVEDPVTKTAAPLHWIISEKSGECIVIEKTEKGLEIFNNTIGVLANAPNFPWHITNLNNYINVSSAQRENTQWGKAVLTAPSQAGGTLGLPGGFASPDRFVRTAFIKTHAEAPMDAANAINLCFQCLQSVTIPKGVILTKTGASDYTQYTAFVDQETGDYYFNTHTNLQIYKVRIRDYIHKYASFQDLGSISKPLQFSTI